MTHNEFIERLKGLIVCWRERDPQEDYTATSDYCSIELQQLLDEFLSTPKVEEVRPGLCVAKESTSIFAEEACTNGPMCAKCKHEPTCEPDRQDCNYEPKPKRKWHKWSELKDKYFSKEKQAEMKEQAKKELEETDTNRRALDHGVRLYRGGKKISVEDAQRIDASAKRTKEKEVCHKCQGAGWLWDFELDNYKPDPHNASIDDQKYSCDACRKKEEE
jgi:hypothetical protein